MNSPACNAGDMRHKGTTAKRLNSVRKIGLSHLNSYRLIIFESNIPLFTMPYPLFQLDLLQI